MPSKSLEIVFVFPLAFLLPWAWLLDRFGAIKAGAPCACFDSPPSFLSSLPSSSFRPACPLITGLTEQLMIARMRFIQLSVPSSHVLFRLFAFICCLFSHHDATAVSGISDLVLFHHNEEFELITVQKLKQELRKYRTGRKNYRGKIDRALQPFHPIISPMGRRGEAFSYGALLIFSNMRCMQYCNVPLLSHAFRRSILYGTYEITYRLTRPLDSHILLEVPLACLGL